MHGRSSPRGGIERKLARLLLNIRTKYPRTRKSALLRNCEFAREEKKGFLTADYAEYADNEDENNKESKK
ncbi:MAG: hypothetical protein C5B50_11165 [Verrucomicrobia bacterium]|nr:MAG: hypothetical protein C5B50_11165 [Verrucomicrobiota bacterium]